MTRTGIMPQAGETGLTGKRIAFTGKLASMTRAEARARVEQAGGEVTTSINRQTDLLVVGMDGWPLLADGRMSNKLQQAERLRQGGRLRICSEERFLEAIGLSDRRSQLHKSYDVEQVAVLVGIDEPTLRRWEALGLVRSHDDRFDFQDLVSLRTIASLLKAGVAVQTISRTMRQLASALPTDRPLAQLKIVSEAPGAGALLAEIDGLLLTSTGQFLMPFDRQENNEFEGAIPFGPRAGAPAHTAEEWYDIACDHEECGRSDDAIAAFRSALSMQPHFAEASFGLANVLRAIGKLEAAEERFRAAIEQNPHHADAWYNLGHLLDETGRLMEAIACLREAVQCSPTHADAQFNLAQCCKDAGLDEEARNHWRQYLKLDPSSEWASVAKDALLAI